MMDEQRLAEIEARHDDHVVQSDDDVMHYLATGEWRKVARQEGAFPSIQIIKTSATRYPVKETA